MENKRKLIKLLFYIFIPIITIVMISLVMINLNKEIGGIKFFNNIGVIEERIKKNNKNEDNQNTNTPTVNKNEDNQNTNTPTPNSNEDDQNTNTPTPNSNEDNQNNNKNNNKNNPSKEEEKVPDVYLLDFTNINIMESGDIDKTTGNNIDNKRRIRTKNYTAALYKEYDVKIQNEYTITIYEYGNNYKYIKSTDFPQNSKITLNEQTKYLKAVLTITDKSKEKSLSYGQWAGKFGPNFVARISIGDIEGINKLNESITIRASKSYAPSEIQQGLFDDSNTVSNKIWSSLVYNKIYTLTPAKLKINERKTYYVSPDGNDNNSGLSANYPKKSLDQFSGISNINILLECGKTYYMNSGFDVGNNVTIASYGQGTKPIINYYRSLNKTFTKVNGVDNLYYADLSNVSGLYNGKKDKSDCNIGQLLINNNINWKRKVYGSDEEFTYSLLTDVKDNWSWAIDVKNARLYIYATSNPSDANIKYAPPVTALSAKGKSNIIIQGIEIRGSGLHGINFTNCTNVNINSNSFKYIGGSILTSAGTRYGNAIQIWDSADNISVTNNFANWIFDTCYTTQGTPTVLKNVTFKNNIGMHSQWGLEIWGVDTNDFSNINYTNNLLINMGDITNPTTKMQCSLSGHLYGEVDSENYITYRYGYTYHQAANLALWLANNKHIPNISNNIFWGTNRFLVIGTWPDAPINITTLNNNLFYEDYHLSYDTIPAMYKIKTSSNKYMTNVTQITSNTTNTEVLHKKGTYNNSNELKKMQELINKIITSN